MSRKPYWTRKLELQLVEFVRQRDFIWKPIGNTNHHIQQKYKAYAEFAAKLGSGFTARSIRDRWVNIRSTFNHNLRRVEKSKAEAKTEADLYVPCWPLWKPLQFLRDTVNVSHQSDYKDEANKVEDMQNYFENLIEIRQPKRRTDRPRRKVKKTVDNGKCKQVLDELLNAMTPLLNMSIDSSGYWFFGRHVVERLNCMREVDARSASKEILKLLEDPENNHKSETEESFG